MIVTNLQAKSNAISLAFIALTNMIFANVFFIIFVVTVSDRNSTD